MRIPDFKLLHLASDIQCFALVEIRRYRVMSEAVCRTYHQRSGDYRRGRYPSKHNSPVLPGYSYIPASLRRCAKNPPAIVPRILRTFTVTNMTSPYIATAAGREPGLTAQSPKYSAVATIPSRSA